MRLSTMVHSISDGEKSRQDNAAEQHRHQDHQQLHSLSRAHQPYRDGPSANPYSSREVTELRQPYHHAARSPPSPPAEEAPRLLPSIHNLLRTADEAESDAQRRSQSMQTQQQDLQDRRQAPPPALSIRPTRSFESRPDSVSSSRVVLPPTPPMIADTAVDDHQSPSNSSSNSPVAAQTYSLGHSLNNMEPYLQRQSANSNLVKHHSVSSHPAISPYQQSPYQISPYQNSPSAASAPAYYSPETYHSAGLASQRPLPSYSPSSVYSTQSSPTANPLQHHHYLNAQSQAAFPQTQDRYVCATCNKAFSRPSSLRIHIHSHSGEKPYKCPQPGCGKAFSVRSNMKRHERGCHAALNPANT